MCASILMVLISISGVLLTATCLVTEMCELNPEIVSHFRRVSDDCQFQEKNLYSVIYMLCYLLCYVNESEE